MTKLKKYNTIEEWETAKMNGNIPYPGVGLIVENGSVAFMKQPIHTLPIKAVFYDSATGSFVKMYPDEITEAIPTYTPIGVEVIPAEHDVYGTGQAGVMSLVGMNYEAPDTGGSSSYMHWGQTGDNSILKRSGVNYIGNGGKLNKEVQGVRKGCYLPSDGFGTWSLDKHSGYYSSNSSYYYAPSPYNVDGSRNEAYISGPDQNALSDFDGIGNTAIWIEQSTYQSDWKTADTIINSYSDAICAPACCSWRFHTVGTEQGQWYVPACGELGYAINRFQAINDTIWKIGNIYTTTTTSVLSTTDNYFWTSTPWASTYCHRINTEKGLVGYGYYNTDSGYARAFIRI